MFKMLKKWELVARYMMRNEERLKDKFKFLLGRLGT